jgi:hypothetical protein
MRGSTGDEVEAVVEVFMGAIVMAPAPRPVAPHTQRARARIMVCPDRHAAFSTPSPSTRNVRDAL